MAIMGDRLGARRTAPSVAQLTFGQVPGSHRADRATDAPTPADAPGPGRPKAVSAMGLL
jgi:hypothetical protein